MKKICILLCALFLCSCAAKSHDDIKLSDIAGKVRETASFSEAREESLLDFAIAERYGISTADIEDGMVYYSGDAKNPDKVLLVKAKSRDRLENVERAASNTLVSMNDAWKHEKTEIKKIERAVLKTNGHFVYLVVADDPEKIVKAIDDYLHKS